MPERVLFDAEGNEVKVPDEADLTALQQSATKVADLQKELEEAKQAANPNWQDTRRIIKELEAENKNLKTLKEKGKTINDQGEVVDYSGTMTPEMIQKTAEDAAQRVTSRVLIGQRVEEHLSNFEPEQAKLVEAYYKKLAAGEDMNIRKVDEIMEAAVNAAGLGVPASQARRTQGISGSGSRPEAHTRSKKENFAETEEGRVFASNLGLRFLNEDKKN